MRNKKFVNQFTKNGKSSGVLQQDKKGKYRIGYLWMIMV